MTKRNNGYPSLRAKDNQGEANPQADDYTAVGYKQPPLESRFKKGRSGNPKGRPKGSWSGKDLLQKALAIPLRITENGVVRTLPQKDVLFRSLLAKAIKGDSKSVALILKLIDKWNIDHSAPTVTMIQRVIVEPDGTYYDLDLGRKASIHSRSPGDSMLEQLLQEGGLNEEIGAYHLPDVT